MKSALCAITVLCAAACLWSADASAPVIREGRVIYDLVSTGGRVSLLEKMLLRGAVCEIAFSGGRIRSEVRVPLVHMVTIVDARKQRGLALIDRPFGKQAVLLDDAELARRRTARREVRVIPGTREKEIAGFRCREATVIATNGVRFTMYAAPRIIPEDLDSENQFPGLDGFPLEMEMERKGIRMVFRAREVLPETPDPDLFVLHIPEGYELVSSDELPAPD